MNRLRDELTAAAAVLAPQIRGLHDLVGVTVSELLVERINEQIAIRERRRDLIQTALADLQALEGDGYPDLASATLPPNLFVELQGEEADLDAAVAIFEPALPAVSVSVDLGAPADKPIL